jgi:hypothetical protein
VFSHYWVAAAPHASGVDETLVIVDGGSVSFRCTGWRHNFALGGRINAALCGIQQRQRRIRVLGPLEGISWRFPIRAAAEGDAQRMTNFINVDIPGRRHRAGISLHDTARISTQKYNRRRTQAAHYRTIASTEDG